MKKILLIFVVCLFVTNIFGQPIPPKYEFRAAWVATVVNLDWPSSRTLTTAKQKEEMVNLFNRLKALNFNAVIFQVRAECDAFYDSPYEPWSYWLTGQQGKAPNPYYDPLSYAVELAHERGMELHAWFNPYRAERSSGNYSLSSEHVASENPEWTFQVGGLKMLDPGLPMVREYVTRVVMDVVERYDIDGVHFDDYFYPYEGMSGQDSDTFNEYSRGFSTMKPWRRDNVNILLDGIYDSIKVAKPWVKFGMSPFGIWRPGSKTSINALRNIVGLDAYDVIYCDAIAWLHDKSVDYLTPQLYWPFGGGQDFRTLSRWWADSTYANNRHLYPGHGAYRITNWSANELPNQLKEIRNNHKINGSVYFRALVGLLDNPRGFKDSLANNYYRFPAITPPMPWIDDVAPNAVKNFRFERLDGTGATALQWDAPDPATDNEPVYRYVVYKFPGSVIPDDFDTNPEYIYAFTDTTYLLPEAGEDMETAFFAVSGMDRLNNERELSPLISVAQPETPFLAFPEDGASDVESATKLQWNYAANASTYRLQISEMHDFEELVIDKEGIADSVIVLSGLDGQQTYYWRVAAENAVGMSAYSESRSFFTAFPPSPELISPEHEAMNVAADTLLVWESLANATTYRIQIARQHDTFAPEEIVIDSSDITDTSFKPFGLEPATIYYWRVAGENAYGTSRWSDAYGFYTQNISSVEETGEHAFEYALLQNYPNPFNPKTQIRFSIPSENIVKLKIYDLYGREVATLVNGHYAPGSYTVEWHGLNDNGIPVSSGFYIYRIQAGDFVDENKMLLLK